MEYAISSFSVCPLAAGSYAGSVYGYFMDIVFIILSNKDISI